jgi:branched-chain amino acid transport system substrate-binding protein
MARKNTRTLQAAAVAGAFTLALAGCSSSASGGDEGGSSASSPQDGVLKVGTVLPQTGSLSFLGPPEFAGVNLAAQQINDAGGVLGKDVEVFEGDSGDTSTNIASTTADQMISRGSDVIIGAASSSVSLSIIDKVSGAGVLQISPANTSTELSTYDDNGLYWRTAPADFFQGQVLAETVASAGKSKPAVVVLQDSYGESLADSFQGNFEAGGGTLAAEPIYYDPKAATFDAEVGQAKAAQPDSIVLIGFEESKKIIQELIKQQIGPDKTDLFLVDGNLSNTLAKGLPSGIMEGTIGTLPGRGDEKAFQQELLEIDPDLTDFSYANEAYDAVVLSALGAIAANSDTGTAIASKLVEVSSGGKKCTTFKKCADLLAKGTDIDYDGRSGPTDFKDNGDPLRAVMGVYEFGADNTYKPVDFVEGTVPDSADGSVGGAPEPAESTS